MKEDSDLCYYQIHQCIDRDSTSYNEASSTSSTKSLQSEILPPQVEDDFPELECFDYTEALPIPKELESLEMPFVEMQ